MTERPEIWRYSFPNTKGSGWAIFYIDSWGFFSCVSDYGDYIHHWPRMGIGKKDFRQFLCEVNRGYFWGKVCGGRGEFDPEATVKHIRQHILEYRRDRTYDRETAREEWELSKYIFSECDFANWVDRTDSVNDPSDCACYRFPADFEGFWANIWPRFVERLKQDLAGEPNEDRDLGVPTREAFGDLLGPMQRLQEKLDLALQEIDQLELENANLLVELRETQELCDRTAEETMQRFREFTGQ